MATVDYGLNAKSDVASGGVAHIIDSVNAFSSGTLVSFREATSQYAFFDFNGVLNVSAMLPTSNDSGALGVSGTAWSDLFLSSGSVINWVAGDVTLTHAAGKLTFGGDGSVEIDFNNHEMTNVDIDSGAIDGTTVGAASASSGAFTTITASSTLAVTGVSTLTGSVGIGVAVLSGVAGGVILSLEGTGGGDGATGEIIISSGDTTLAAGQTVGGLAFKGNDDANPAEYVGIQGTSIDTAGLLELRFYSQSGAYVSDTPDMTLDNSGNLIVTGLITATAGLTSGSNIISDTDSTDDLGSTGVRWANLWVDAITLGGTLAGAVATFSSTLAVTGDTTLTGDLLTNADDSTAIGVSGTAFSDLFLASGAVINFAAGDMTLTHATGLLTIAGGDMTVTDALSGTTTFYTFTNSNNSNGASHSRLGITTGGNSGGDPYLYFLVSGQTDYYIGIDNSDTDAFVIGSGNAVGTAPAITITKATRNITIDQDLEIDGDLDHDGTNVGFYGTTPVAQQTSVAVTEVAIHAALVSLGLITA